MEPFRQRFNLPVPVKCIAGGELDVLRRVHAHADISVEYSLASQ